MTAFPGATADFFLLVLLGAFLVLGVQWRLTSIEMRSRLSQLDLKLNLLLKHAGVEHEPYKNLPREVVDALQRGQKIQAIYHYRKATKVGLKEAKAFIEDIQERAGDGP